jgi:hypothetical protein
MPSHRTKAACLKSTYYSNGNPASYNFTLLSLSELLITVLPNCGNPTNGFARINCSSCGSGGTASFQMQDTRTITVGTRGYFTVVNSPTARVSRPERHSQRANAPYATAGKTPDSPTMKELRADLPV